ncbi:MAG: hypothetical protein EBZ24_14980, partial [Synechococcaceae bacterium WB9_4xB_025]|nr:hypothetical protein [Synechococcaceae bacterium WB9_4xB_025]
MSFAVPVLLIAFNRPGPTARVLEVLRELQPERLYVACDGPRSGRPEEARRCEAVRALVSQMDWPCDLQTLFQPSNLGCRAGVTTALDWFGPGHLTHASVRDIRGAANDDVVLVLKHDSGVDSYLSASAIVGAPGPKLRLNGDQGSLVIVELDRQEELLRKGFQSSPDVWLPPLDITCEARIHKGADSFTYQGVPGSYPSFYRKVR